MALFGINFSSTPANIGLIPELWPMTLRANLYTEIQMHAVFTRILSEVFARSQGIADEWRPLLRNSLAGTGQKGLIERIVTGMVQQKTIALKYEAGIIIEPDHQLKQKIIDEVKKGKIEPRTLVLSFQDYHKATILRQYLLHKYLLLCAQHKALNLSTALQIKLGDLRSSVSMKDFKAEGGPYEQAKEIAEALLDGRPVALDTKDILELLTPDMGPLKEVAKDIHSEMSLILGLPISWITGTAESGLGDSGDKDARAIERGLEPYFWESAYPAFQNLFGTKLRFKTEDYRNITPALDAMRTFQLDDGDLLPKEIQQRILYQLLDIQEEPPGVEEREVTEQENVKTPAPVERA